MQENKRRRRLRTTHDHMRGAEFGSEVALFAIDGSVGDDGVVFGDELVARPRVAEGVEPRHPPMVSAPNLER